MTEHNPYPAQVADLITDGMAALGDGLTHDPGAVRDKFLAESRAKLAAAQAVATLAHAHETRTAALVALAALDPSKVEQAGPLPQEAYLAAAYALGMADDDDAPAEVHGENDPADADFGDLK